MTRSAAIFGATGLVGRACLDLLLADDRYGRVVAVGRREPANAHAKLVVRRVALDSVEAIDDSTLSSVDDVFCCLGTTIRKAGSQEAFRRVDLDYVVNAAAFAEAAGRGALPDGDGGRSRCPLAGVLQPRQGRSRGGGGEGRDRMRVDLPAVANPRATRGVAHEGTPCEVGGLRALVRHDRVTLQVSAYRTRRRSLGRCLRRPPSRYPA